MGRPFQVIGTLVAAASISVSTAKSASCSSSFPEYPRRQSVSQSSSQSVKSVSQSVNE